MCKPSHQYTKRIDLENKQTVQKSLVRQAAKAFADGKYRSALRLYNQLGWRMGKHLFEYNVQQCKKKIQTLAGGKHSTQLRPHGLRIACIMDEFSYNVFLPECQLYQLNAHCWQCQLEESPPALIFVESAWNGAADTWKDKVSRYSNDICTLFDYAQKSGIPTLFWCKEDPVHFSRFIHVARLADYVFTTDVDCIQKYKSLLQHDDVYFLPFCVQPKLHNPVETVPREDVFAFAGSWYPHYLDRQRDFCTLLSVARKFKKVKIYDRNADKPQPHLFVFPVEFQQELCGCLPYTALDKAYKGCHFGITVNTVKQSQTMFARRVFELMACNTIVMSNYSRGIRYMLGDIVISSDNADELENRLLPLMNNVEHYKRHRLRALRKVLNEHCAWHRLAYIVEKILFCTCDSYLPNVACIGEAHSDADVELLLSILNRQTSPPAKLLIVGKKLNCVDSRVEFFANRSAAMEQMRAFDYVAPLASSDYYGPEYLNDMVHAICFSPQGATKTAFFYVNASGDIALQGDGQQYKLVTEAVLCRSVLPPALLQSWIGDESTDIHCCIAKAEDLIAVDEFSYCALGIIHETASSIVDVETLPRSGLSLENNSFLLCHQDSELQSKHTVFLTTLEWFSLLPALYDPHIYMTRQDVQWISLKSTLSEEEHKYIYFTTSFNLLELQNKTLSFVVGEHRNFDVRLVIVYCDSFNEQISFAKSHILSTLAVNPPVGAIIARIALRITGAGEIEIGNMLAFSERKVCSTVQSMARNLVIANQYPSYDNLYKYAFVHSRVRAYVDNSLPVEVFKVKTQSGISFSEFEGIDIVEGDVQYLEHKIISGEYATLLVHIITPNIWKVLRENLDSLHVIIWVHGAEAQPWWRRSSLKNESSRREYSKIYMTMWKDILTLSHAHMQIIFISKHLMQQVLSDVGFAFSQVKNIHVISNYIDGDMFSYVQKAEEQRHRLLSIRPFVSPIYANDLTVKAILKLASEPFFDQLHIRIIGDGPLFEETLAPLRRYPNVEITQKFFTRKEIAELHKEYGIFLSPSRMDSQGVSRDEAMASGLVPITSRVAAIPEFVDEECGFLVAPEDAEGIAEAVRRLHYSPELFLKLSAAASRRVRKQSNFAQTIAREMALIHGESSQESRLLLDEISIVEQSAFCIAMYGDINMNLMDGSAVWAASFAEVLGGIPDVHVSLLLQSQITRTLAMSRLLHMSSSVQIIEPQGAEGTVLKVKDAVLHLLELDKQHKFQAFVLRGFAVCCEAAKHTSFHGRLWAYITDIPQEGSILDDATRGCLYDVVKASQYVFCQTSAFQQYLISIFPEYGHRFVLLPPMIPPVTAVYSSYDKTECFRLGYAGKFAPLWGIRSLFSVWSAIHQIVPTAELHIFGDKIHTLHDDPLFHTEVKQYLTSGKGVVWHGAVERDVVLRQLAQMHACWAFREPAFERSTLELSTKVLEYASIGVPIILARSSLYENLLGTGYPLFAATEDEAYNKLLLLFKEPAFGNDVSVLLQDVAKAYTFSSIRSKLVNANVFNK